MLDRATRAAIEAIASEARERLIDPTLVVNPELAEAIAGFAGARRVRQEDDYASQN